MKLGGRSPRSAPGAKPQAFTLAMVTEWRRLRLRARKAPRARSEGNAEYPNVAGSGPTDLGQTHS